MPIYLYLPVYTYCLYLPSIPVCAYLSIPTCLCLLVYTYLSIPTCLYLPVYTYLSIPTVYAYVCTYLSVPTYLYLPACAYLSIPTVYTYLYILLCLPVCNLGERSAQSKAPSDLINQLIVLIRIILYGRSLAVHSNSSRLGCLPRRP
jgi:hypothetical protein